MPDSKTAIGTSISEQLYNDLLSGIQVGDYPPLGPLPTEAMLARDYGVSRSVVRAALSVLKEDGIVISRQGSGTIVAPSVDTSQVNKALDINTDELRDCYACRESLEPDIAACAAANRTKRDVRYLEDQLQNITDELALGTIHTGNDADFHIHLAKMTGNKFYESVLNSLRPFILIGMNLAKTLPVHDRKRHQRASLEEHRAIAQAVVTGDCAGARKAMALHLATGLRRIFPTH